MRGHGLALSCLAGLAGIVAAVTRARGSVAKDRPTPAARPPTRPGADTTIFHYDAATAQDLGALARDRTVFTYDLESGDILSIRRG